MADLENEALEESGEEEVFDFRNRSRQDKFILSEEVAQRQLAIFLDYYEIYTDEFEEPETIRLYNMHAGAVLLAIRMGRLTITDEGDDGLTMRQKLRSGDYLNYKVLTGESKLDDRGAPSRDEPMEAQGTRRRYSILGALTGVGIDGVQKLKANDLSTAESISFLFSL